MTKAAIFDLGVTPVDSIKLHEPWPSGFFAIPLTCWIIIISRRLLDKLLG